MRIIFFNKFSYLNNKWRFFVPVYSGKAVICAIAPCARRRIQARYRSIYSVFPLFVNYN